MSQLFIVLSVQAQSKSKPYIEALEIIVNTYMCGKSRWELPS